jgi:predicted Zn-dependent protease
VLRALVALFAILVCAWFAIGVRQARDVDHATALLSAGSHISGSDAARAASLLHSAGQLNPDRQVDVLRAQLATERGDRRSAEGILGGVVAAEPMNATAWVALARSATNGGTLRLAFRRLAVLVPPVHQSHH